MSCRFPFRRELICCLASWLVGCHASTAVGQTVAHPLIRSDMPPGAVSTIQAGQPGAAAGYVQPVEIVVPEGAVVAAASGDQFEVAVARPRVGLMLGQAYRLRIRNIPRHEGVELYPSIELVSRLHPPPGQKNRFPVPIHITQDDLEQALRGSLVVRVIYLEDPTQAFPRHDGGEQRSVDALPGEDPLHLADDYGRPMAIVRIGSRVPVGAEFDSSFLYGCPPIEWISDDETPLDTTQVTVDSGAFARPLQHGDPKPLPRDASWLEQAIDPNCPCLYGHDPADCNCGGGDRAAGRPEGITGPWPPDEYICDGGDWETRFVVNDQSQVSGLDLEDTVAHYDTLDGRTLTAVSNSVCIYAPRFAAIRKIVQASEDLRLVSMEELEQPRPPIVELSERRPEGVDQPLPAIRLNGLRGPLGLRTHTPGSELVRILAVEELVSDLAPHEDLQIIRIGIHARSEIPVLVEATQAAQVWTDYLAPEVIIDEVEAQVDVRVERAEALYRVEQGPPGLRLVKIASCCSARPGEEVVFTLRFDNIGDQTLNNVTLLDNLTTRLEYLPDTAESTVAADFSVEENQGGSSTLRWRLRDPIPPGAGGIIRFRTRVR